MRYFAPAFILIWLTACASGESADLMMPDHPALNSPDLNQDNSRDAEQPEEGSLSCSEPSRGHDPNGVHDLGDGPHFEGWYYRITQPDSENSWVLIAAYWMDKDKQGHAFVELIHSPSGQTFKEVFTDVDIERIQDTAGTFELQLGELWLSADRIKGAITPSQHNRIFVDLTVEGCALGCPR